jgi:hypothetical protein
MRPVKRTLILLALLAAACGPTKETEPNDSFQQATYLKAGQVAKGRLSSAKDEDWYRVESAGGSLAARIGGIRDVDFTLTLLDKDRAVLKKVDETVAGGDEALLDAGLPTGSYYLVVANKNEKAANAEQEYELVTTVLPAAGLEAEPTGTVRGHYWPTRDLLSEDPDAVEEDWYAVDVAREGVFLLNVDVSEVPKVDPQLEVYDATGYKLKELDAGGVGEAESLRSFGVRGPAKFFLRLRTKHKGAGNAEVPYDLMTELLPYQGRVEFEPNEQPAEATPVAGDSIQGAMSPAGDVDWYKVTTDSATKSVLRAELSGLPNANLILSVRDAFGNDLLVVDNMGKEQPEVLTGWGLPGGDAYIVVTEKDGRKADARRTYTLDKKLIPFQEGLEWEPNDSTRTVQAIKPGATVDGYLAPKGDQDWYEFNLYQKGVLRLEVSGVFNVAPELTLYDQEFTVVGTFKAGKVGLPAELTKEAEPGTYYVRVSAADAAQNNTRDKYSFRVGVK